MTSIGWMDSLFIVLGFMGVWVFSAASSSIRILLPQQITDLQANKKLFAGTVSWLANRQNHTIRIGEFANTFCFLLVCIFAGKNQLTITILKSTSTFIALGYLVLLIVILLAIWNGVDYLGKRFGKSYPIQAIQVTALPAKVGYLILYPLLALSQFFTYLGSD